MAPTTKRKPIPLTLRFQLEKDDSERVDSKREQSGYASDDVDDGSSFLPSPSPTPRPGSALSLTSTLTLTRRSLTPITSVSNNVTTSDGFLSVQNPNLVPRKGHRSVSPRENVPIRRVVSDSVTYNPPPTATSFPERNIISFDDAGLDIMDRRLTNLQRNLDSISRQISSISLDHNGRAGPA